MAKQNGSVAKAELVQEQFDYDRHEIKAASRKKLEAIAGRIAKRNEVTRRTMVETVLKNGEDLEAAHEELANKGNGTFEKWAMQRLSYKKTMVHAIIGAYRWAEGSKFELSSADASALYILGQPAAVDLSEHCKAAAEAGVPLTHAFVKGVERLLESVPNDKDIEPAIKELTDLAKTKRVTARDAKAIAEKYGAEQPSASEPSNAAEFNILDEAMAFQDAIKDRFDKWPKDSLQNAKTVLENCLKYVEAIMEG